MRRGLAKKLLAAVILAAALSVVAIIWGCSGTSSSPLGNPSQVTSSGGVIVSPSPPGQNTNGTTGLPGATTLGSNNTTTTTATTATGTTTGATSAATTTASTTTASATTASTTGGTTTGTTSGNTTQIPVINSAGSFPYAFTSPVTVNSGSTVDWVNQTGVSHGISWDTQNPTTSPAPGNNIPIFSAGTTSEAWQVPTVTVQTTYNYHCTVHGTSMLGKVIVNP